MKRRPWTFDHVVAVVELVCAVVVVVWLSATGIDAEATAGRSPVDRAFPFVLGAVVGAVLVWWSVRSWRAGDRTADPDAERAPAREGPDPFAVEPLSPDGQREVARVVGVLAGAGVFAPRVPRPEHLYGPVADQGEPVTAWTVLSALHEAGYHVPGFDAAAHSANLAFDDSQAEQSADVVESHVDDLVRLGGGGLGEVAVEVELVHRDGTARVPTRVRLTVDGVERVLAYDGAGKSLSTVVHVALARILRERGAGRRSAWLWSDQGVWLSGLPDGAVEQLNASLGPAADGGWEWVDEQEPFAAGDTFRP